MAFVLLLDAAIFAPEWFTRLAPDAIDTDAILQPPGPGHWFGTDELGRDVFCRVIYGTSESLTIGVGAMAIACLGGISLGTAASLAPRLLRAVLIRLIDILLAFPETAVGAARHRSSRAGTAQHFARRRAIAHRRLRNVWCGRRFLW